MAIWKEVNEDRYFDQLGVVPPLKQKDGCFMVGEALSFDRSFGFIYTTLAKVNERYFETILPSRDFNPEKFRAEVKSQFNF